MIATKAPLEFENISAMPEPSAGWTEVGSSLTAHRTLEWAVVATLVITQTNLWSDSVLVNYVNKTEHVCDMMSTIVDIGKCNRTYHI